MRHLALLWLISGVATAQVGSVASTCIWSGTVADCLPSAGILLRDQRDVRFGEAAANGTNYVAIQAPATLAADVTLTLPVDDGNANDVLVTNGSGVLTWTAYVAPTQQRFTTGSGTYTTPTSPRTPLYIRVRMVGGGGGGMGGGADGASMDGAAGNNTTFGSSLLTANGGSAGTYSSGGGQGGGATLNSPAIGTALAGGKGQDYMDFSGTVAMHIFGGQGGASCWGGNGRGSVAGNGGAGQTNTGGGGGGAGVNSAGAATLEGGSGGGAGGCVDAIIASPSATYSYAVGALAAGGTGSGTGAVNGGNGGSGYIEVTEYYQ